MNRAIWISRKNYLLTLIKKVDKGCGGDDPGFLKEHCDYIIEHNQGEKIEDAIHCYEEMVEQLKHYKRGTF